MKLAAPLALLLVAGLVACGSTAPNERAAIAEVIRASGPHVKVLGVRISKLDSRYAVAQVLGPRLERTWILRRSGSTWQPTSVENFVPDCGAAPPKVFRELTGGSACDPPVGVYTSIYWTHDRTVRMRYCQRPGGPGNFLAASKGVTCRTAANVIHAATHRCAYRGSCVDNGFRCRAYYSGRYAGSFQFDAHALCTDGSRRIAWDGG